MTSFVSHLECARCGRQFEPGKVYNLCTCGSPLLVRYDLGLAAEKIGGLDRLAARPPTLWRYREVLPVSQDASVVSLGEGFTPLVHARLLGAKLGIPNLFLKDESQNPTGTFKARGMAVAVSMARELGIRKMAIPSAGNAAAALSAYAAHAGLQAAVFIPEETPLAIRMESSLLGADVTLVPGSIKDCARVLHASSDDWFDLSTMREPYRVEGKKTMAYELVEQFHGRVPDAILFPTGGGTGLVGMWKAFEEMEQLGWIPEGARPRMFAVQATGCAPLVRAFAAGAERAEEWLNPSTFAPGLRAPAAIADFLILRALRESRGGAIAVDDDAMIEGMSDLARAEGVITSPEGGATLAALQRLHADGIIADHETVVLFLTASGYKYTEALKRLFDREASRHVPKEANASTPAKTGADETQQ